jgi:PAS domain S-box-containing protein
MPRDPAKIAGHPQRAKPIKRGGSSLKRTLLRSADWLQLAAQGGELGLWHWDEVRKRLHWDLKTREMFGGPRHGRVTLQTFVHALHPEDRVRVMRTWRFAFENRLPYSIELRAVRPDGSVRWIHGRGKSYYAKNGTPLYMVGVVFDVTERKEAEQERFELSGRLINAQEKERGRLARELHDDFSQRLALLANDLEGVAEMIPDSPTEAAERVRELWNTVSEIGADLHSLSHRLHSGTLETLGLTASVNSYCQEVARKQAVQVDVVHEEVPNWVNSETMLCLFRIVQESLRNVIKHSGASRVEVRLKGNGDAISLTISDNGIGFEASKCYPSHGIGIQSMRERARMLAGTFEVRSEPMQGAQVVVTIPLKVVRAAA